MSWEELIFVFVDGLLIFTRVEWLSSAFSQFGKVVDAFIPNSSRKGRSGCFGFVRFREKKDCNEDCGGHEWKQFVR